LQNDEIIENVEYEETFEGKIYEKTQGEWQFIDDTTESVSISGLIFSEIYPSPQSGEQEWIEFYNPFDFTISSDLLTIQRDTCDTPNIIKNSISFDIFPKSTTVVNESDLNKKLLNAGGTLVMCDLNVQAIDTVTYPGITNGQSYSRIFENSSPTEFWLTTDQSSKGEMNLIVGDIEIEEEDMTDLKTIREVRAYANETQVIIKGVVTAKFNQNYFYIQDSTSGIWIDIRFLENIDISIGDEYEVTGTISSEHGERKIRVSNVIGLVILAKNSTIPTATSILNHNSLHEYEGMLVNFSGEVVAKFAKSFDIENGPQKIRVSVFDTTNIDISDIAKGNMVEVTGILSKQDEEFRILPRSEADLNIEVIAEDLENTVDDADDSIANNEKAVLGEKTGTSVESVPSKSATVFPLPSLDINTYEYEEIRDAEVLRNLQYGILGYLVILVAAFCYMNRAVFKNIWVAFTNEFKQFQAPEKYIPIRRRSG
jgi:uncharacterized protein YdeI (BOF family)